MNNGSNSLEQKHRPLIMIVDDDELVTTTLASYLGLETDFDVVAYQSPADALGYLENKPVDLLITDFLMPDMDGLEFLSEVQKLYPNLTSILLTGYADKENAIKAINEVSLFQYVEKPWDNDHLMMVIRNALNSKELREGLASKVRELDAVLLERSRLFEANEAMRDELNLARSVQQSMLPQTFPNSCPVSVATRYQPALEVGGDFYDVVSLSEHKLGVFVADVTGHGIQAALITVLLKSAFLELKGQEESPGAILARLNTLLYQILPKTLYVAGLIMIMDTRTGECRLVNAGIPHPFVLRAGKQTAERIPANGLLLGVAAAGVYKAGKEIEFRMEPGDTLLLYTDGLSEVHNEADELFEDCLLKTLSGIPPRPVTAALDTIIAAAENFARKNHAWDDVTAVGIGFCHN